jgi:hypothetical protein
MNTVLISMHVEKKDCIFFYKNGLVVCVFVADMLEGLKYANFEAFLYLSEYQHVMRLLFRGLNKWAPKPQVLGVET